ncbi:MAG TPA: type V CRISPR-associated protein Cas12k [Leptolyngbyaceae cyanobacterium]
MFQVIQCRLVANANTRQKLWQLMADKNTPLINELLLQVAQHPEFETWRHKGKLPTGIVKQLCESLKTDPRFAGQPARFFTSALEQTNYIYKSWLALMKRCLLFQRRYRERQSFANAISTRRQNALVRNAQKRCRISRSQWRFFRDSSY